MATLNYKHSANPGRSYHRAHYTIVRTQRRKYDARFSSLDSSRLHDYIVRASASLTGRGARRLAAAH